MVNAACVVTGLAKRGTTKSVKQPFQNAPDVAAKISIRQHMSMQFGHGAGQLSRFGGSRRLRRQGRRLARVVAVFRNAIFAGRATKLGTAALLLAISIIGLLLCSPEARAQDSRAQDSGAQDNVVLVNSTAPLLRATERALRPWKTSVTALDSEEVSPSESMPGARDRAQELCDAHQAQAVVWLTSNQEGEALWVYDQQSDRVVVRKLRVRLPLGDADAAAVALSIKTLLMHTTAAPPAQRFGAKEQEKEPRPRHAQATSQWMAHGALLARRGVGEGHSDARLGFGLFRNFEPLQIGVILAAGPGYGVDSPTFQGHVVNASLAMEVRIRKASGAITWMGLGQLAMHRTHLDGTLAAGGSSVEDTRYNPSLALGGALEVPLGVARFGLGLRTRYYTRSQRYLVQNAPVLDLPTVDVEVGLFVGIPL